MHGIGHHFVLGTSLRSLSARMAFSRPLKNDVEFDVKGKEPTDMNLIPEKYGHVEFLSYRDKVQIALFKRYSQMIYRTLELKGQKQNIQDDNRF